MAQSYTEKIFKPLTAREKWLAEQIVDIAIMIHKMLGPGLLESVYEKCFCHELRRRGIPFVRQKVVELVFNGEVTDDGLRIDLLVDDLVIVELKAHENTHLVWETQLLSYLKIDEKKIGIHIEFSRATNERWHKENDTLTQ